MKVLFLDNVLVYCDKYGSYHTHTTMDVDEKFYCDICYPTNSLHEYAILGEDGKSTGETKIANWFTHKKIWRPENETD